MITEIAPNVAPRADIASDNDVWRILSDPLGAVAPGGWKLTLSATVQPLAGGYAAVVPATMTCPKGAAAELWQAQFSQSDVRTSANTTGSTYPCTGKPQLVLMTITTSQPHRLHQGPAKVLLQMADAEEGSFGGQATAHRTVTVGEYMPAKSPPPPNPHPKPVSIQFAPTAVRLVDNYVAVEDLWIRCPKGHGFGTNSGWFDLSQPSRPWPDTLLAPFSTLSPPGPYGQPGTTCTGGVQHEYLIARGDATATPFTAGKAVVHGMLDWTENGAQHFQATIRLR